MEFQRYQKQHLPLTTLQLCHQTEWHILTISLAVTFPSFDRALHWRRIAAPFAVRTMWLIKAQREAQWGGRKPPSRASDQIELPPLHRQIKLLPMLTKKR